MKSANHDHAQGYARADRLPYRQLDDQTVIVDPRRREVHVLNGMASVIWELLAEPRSLVGLVAALEHDGPFDAGFETIAKDLQGFLADMTEKGLVTVVPAPPTGPDSQR